MKRLSNRDRVILVFGCAFIVIGLLWQLSGLLARQLKPVPKIGGDYIEGYLPESQADVDQAIAQLTNVGLTKATVEGIKPALATAWTVSGDGKDYQFTLHDAISAEEVKTTLQDNAEDLATAEISVTDEHGLHVKLAKPFAPLLANLSNPIFPYGSYLMVYQNDRDTVLARNETAIEPPFIKQVIFRQYPDTKALSQALRDRRIDGTSEAISTTQGYRQLAITLEKRLALICNVTVDPCKQATWRTTFYSDNSFPAPQTIEITALDNSTNRTFLEHEAQLVQARNITLNIKWVGADEFNQTVLPEQTYQMILMGVDYGKDNDPYPYWHASQIGASGFNVSGISNYDLDQLLERYRITSNQQQRKQYRTQIDDLLSQLALVKYYDPIVDYYILSDKIKTGSIVGDGFSSSDRFQAINNWYIKQRYQIK